MARPVLPDPPLGDGVIALRGFASCDVGALVAICQDPEIPRWTLACAEIGDMLDAPARGRLRPDG
jgi:hypothetical protein